MPISFPVTIQTMKVSDGPQKYVYYPQVTQLKNRQIEQHINRTIINHTQKLMDIQFGNMPSVIVEMVGSFEIKNNQRDILSLTLSNYAYPDRAAHGMTYLEALTFNVITGKQYQLKDLFKPGSNYIEIISRIIKEQIKKRDLPVINEFREIKPDQDFYIADKTVVIYFQLYDLVPYAYGFPMFPISIYDIQDIIDENGPLGKMLAGN
ncbi:DUF3298 and DUF4163 domain-containing protein [Pallidibacillus thermolactis]|jgi:hypothetical protein|uniref:DUF3298 and DUF4163 domain-containing protein n=1 Tax=Pallidibacillus thermolactis TaxID=251051 RepID=UPI0021D9BAB6|nr:DUF3298 and DUF4163 domain-containing protein [Pallidibacillus thermolactis]MCU9601913.1 DUF3298 and DUF4163 domain-containing protein [Pallidibacillus thermolactis subsp. kokeshiiformis]